jgi:hypothetical protein
MDVSDAELREMIRDVIASRASRAALDASAVVSSGLSPAGEAGAHASHARFALTRGGDDGACLIEPAVRCNHCGFCLSFGH